MFQRHATFICRTEVLGAPETSFLMPSYENIPLLQDSNLLRASSSNSDSFSPISPTSEIGFRRLPSFSQIGASLVCVDCGGCIVVMYIRLRRRWWRAALNCNLEIQDDRNRILAAISHHTQTGKGREGKESRKRRRQSARCGLRK